MFAASGDKASKVFTQYPVTLRLDYLIQPPSQQWRHRILTDNDYNKAMLAVVCPSTSPSCVMNRRCILHKLGLYV